MPSKEIGSMHRTHAVSADQRFPTSFTHYFLYASHMSTSPFRFLPAVVITALSIRAGIEQVCAKSTLRGTNVLSCMTGAMIGSILHIYRNSESNSQQKTKTIPRKQLLVFTMHDFKTTTHPAFNNNQLTIHPLLLPPQTQPTILEHHYTSCSSTVMQLEVRSKR